MKAAETSQGKCPLDIDLKMYECLFAVLKYGILQATRVFSGVYFIAGISIVLYFNINWKLLEFLSHYSGKTALNAYSKHNSFQIDYSYS